MQAFANALAAEARLFVTRAKSTGSILYGLAIAISGSAIALFLYIVCNATPFQENDQPWLLLWIIEIAALGYGGYVIAIALPGLFRRKFTDAPGTARWATIEDLQTARVIGKTVDPTHDLY